MAPELAFLRVLLFSSVNDTRCPKVGSSSQSSHSAGLRVNVVFS